MKDALLNLINFGKAKSGAFLKQHTGNANLPVEAKKYQARPLCPPHTGRDIKTS